MKILIAGHDLKFINFYIEHLIKMNYEVRTDQWENHVAHNLKHSFEMLDWADIILCEWGLGNSVFYSNYKRKNQRLIVRLHRQELETSYLNAANVDNIDAFITVSPYIYEEFSRTFNLPRKKMKLIFNNVDLEKFYDKKFGNREYKIGMVGYLPKLKRMDLALDLFEKLYEENSRYTLHFKGRRPEELRWLWRNDEEREYFLEQFKRIENAKWKENIIFETYSDDVVNFYNQMEFVLSISDIESFHLAAAESMACRTIPIISNWEGSHTIYSKDFILKDLNHVEEYITSMRSNKETIYKKLAEDVKSYDEKEILLELNKIILN